MKILIIDHFHEDFLQMLNRVPAKVVYVPDIQRDGVKEELGDTDILIMASKVKVDEELVQYAPKLKLVLRGGVGMDHIDLELLKGKGIMAKNTAGGNANAVAEQTVCMMLMLLHHVGKADKEVRKFQWLREENRGMELKEKTVGIIGYGNTGSTLARRLSGFSCRIIAYDKYRSFYGSNLVEEVEFEQVIAESDIISLHVPLTEETHYWMNHDFFAKLPRPILLLNLARGPIVHLPSLLDALDSGIVTGAALDVLENEKMDKLTPAQRGWYENLFARENVVLTPHIGGWSIESRQNIHQMLFDHVNTFLMQQHV